MPRPRLDTEDQLERETMKLFQQIGWQAVFAMDEWDHPVSPLGRGSKAEVVLPVHLRTALERLNPGLAAEAIDRAIDELTRDRSALSPAAANREVYRLLKDGVLVILLDDEGSEQTERVRVIDWSQPANNDFLLVSQFWVSGETYTRRADLVGFVNGLPLVLIELKAHHRALHAAYQDNLRDYKNSVPQLFWYNALVLLSNGSDSRVGSMTATWEHFNEWKRINSEGEQGRISLETTVRATCTAERLLDLAEHFTLFEEGPGGLAKLTAKNHQYLGVNNAVQAVRDMDGNQRRLGVFWHTQGSGKSYSMVFFAQKILRSLRGNWTFLIVTDRLDLDDQIYKNFVRVGAVTEEPRQVRAQDGAHLRQLLQEDHRYLFTLIQKFRSEGGAPYPKLSDRSDIIVITDEAHRSQYDVFAQNMRSALPNAAFIGFTGTPLIQGEQERTRAVFGDYVSVYSFRQSVEDQATVPLFYENRIPELQIASTDLNAAMEQLLDEAALDQAQERRLEREFAREYHLITRDERLETVARDIVSHFLGRGFPGKAMVVSIDKATAVRMYTKVQRYWQAALVEHEAALDTATDEQRPEIERRIAFLRETDMAVVVSSAQNEVEDFQKLGLDITPHRRRMLQEDLDTKFKDPSDPFRLVFVCAMWMTGFDVPSCSTIYLDKPMRNHTLMQTIARANRVFKDKVNGLIVDYVGVFRSLQQALAIYAGGGGAADYPVQDKAALLAELDLAVSEASSFCAAQGVDLAPIEAASTVFDRIALIDTAVEALLVNDEQTQQYLALARRVDRLFHAILPDPAANSYGPTRAALVRIADHIRNDVLQTGDISGVRDAVSDLLDDAIITTSTYRIGETESTSTLGEAPSAGGLVDLSGIDFAALRERFEAGRKHTAAEQLKGKLGRKLARMVRLNRTRMNYLERFQALVDEYNAGAANVDAFFAQLVSFAEGLDAEEQRTIAERLDEEELAVFDLLTRPDVAPTAEQAAQIKEVARDLLATLKREKLVLDWRKKQQARAAVQVTIAEVLDHLPDLYDKERYDQKCQVVYQHIFDSYYGAGQSIYQQAA